MEKFPHQEYRDSLAENINKFRREGRTEEASQELKEARENLLYKAADILHKLEKLLPHEFVVFCEETHPDYLSIENSSDWTSHDIKSHIPQEYEILKTTNLIKDFLNTAGEKNHHLTREDKMYIFKELEVLENILGEKNFEQGKRELYSDVTNGEYDNPINMVHSVGAYTGIPSKTSSFVVDSEIKWGEDASMYFEYRKSTRGWSRGISPNIIVSPYNQDCRSFIKNFFNEGVYSEEEIIERINRGYDISDLLFLCAYPPLGEETGSSELIIHPPREQSSQIHSKIVDLMCNQGKLSEYPGTGYSFSDIADMIVDLRVGKVFKKNRKNLEDVQEDINKYRKILDSVLAKKGKFIDKEKWIIKSI